MKKVTRWESWRTFSLMKVQISFLAFAQVFRDVFYPIIRDGLDGFDPYTQTHLTDMDFTKLDGGVLDSK